MASIIKDLLKPLEAILLQFFKIVFKALETIWLLSFKIYWTTRNNIASIIQYYI